MKEENRCLCCNRRNKSGYCTPLKILVKGGLERFDCKYFLSRKDNPLPDNTGKGGGCAGCS